MTISDRYRPTHGLWLLVLIALLSPGPGCSRQLNDRYDFEHREAAAHFRQQGLDDLQNARLSEALSNFTEAIRVYPSDADSHWQIGRIYLTISDHDRAERSFAKAAAADPKRYETVDPQPIEFDPELTDDERAERVETAAALIGNRDAPDDADWVDGE